MRCVILTTFLALLATATTVVRADEAKAPPQAQGPYVVLVGVGEFSDKAIQPRPTAEADARAFYDLVTDPQYLGVPKNRVALLTATPDAQRGAKSATRENILAALHAAVAGTGKDDTILIGWFGRGASAGDQTTLFAEDTNFKERAKTAVLGSDLEAELKPAKGRKIALLMDVSFKGFDPGKEKLAEPGLRDVLAAVFGGEEKGEGPTPHDRVVFLATVPSHEPLTKGQHGLFAADILDALKGKADTDGYEPDGLVTVDELVKYLETEIANDARQLGKTTQEKESVPFIVGEKTSHFPLTKNPAITPAVQKRLARLNALEQNKTLTPDIAEEGRALLTRMPKLKTIQELRKKYQALADGTLTPDQFAADWKAIKESLKLSPAEAEKFERTVFKSIDMVSRRYVKPLNIGDLTAYAIKGMYERLDIPLPENLAAELKEPKKLTRSKLERLLIDARTQLGKREDLESGKDADIAILMMLAGMNDPYTTYYDHDLLKKTASQLRGEFRGVGIQIRRDLVRDGLLVVSPIKGSPAYKAGIQAGDLITEVKRDTDPEGKPLKEGEPRVISTKGMKTEGALDLILGKPGVPVTLVVQREGEKEPLEFTIPRGVVSVETVLGVKRDSHDDWDYFLDRDKKIAYICLTQFAPSTFRDLYKALKEIEEQGVKGLVLDLRYNPGGLLQAAVLICDLFLEDGLIVSVRPRVGEAESYYDRGAGKFTNFPIAVLVNGYSASAAEILSACLQDYNRAVVVGERSYGKGSVQSVEDFSPTGGQIKMTTARYFPPLGRNIDKLSTGGKDDEEWGVKPDRGYEVKLSREEKQDLADHFRDREVIAPKHGAAKPEEKPFTDRQLDKAVDYLKNQVKSAQSGSRRKAG
ncbi:MAG: S41 family peptidase [Bacteroidales bacterium]|nr:S41 family peptidase [Bacteroidales bacterium]